VSAAVRSFKSARCQRREEELRSLYMAFTRVETVVVAVLSRSNALFTRRQGIARPDQVAGFEAGHDA
jgi:ATP-dependent exoDNAse (exonuclease V) beta subunit